MGIITKRITNPLQPLYDIIGKQSDNPYGSSLLSKSTKNSHELIRELNNNSKNYQIESQRENFVPKFEDSTLSKNQNNRYSNNGGLDEIVRKDEFAVSNNLSGNAHNNQYYGFMHDKYLISGQTNPLNSRISTLNKSLLNPDTARKFDIK